MPGPKKHKWLKVLRYFRAGWFDDDRLEWPPDYPYMPPHWRRPGCTYVYLKELYGLTVSWLAMSEAAVGRQQLGGGAMATKSDVVAMLEEWEAERKRRRTNVYTPSWSPSLHAKVSKLSEFARHRARLVAPSGQQSTNPIVEALRDDRNLNRRRRSRSPSGNYARPSFEDGKAFIRRFKAHYGILDERRGARPSSSSKARRETELEQEERWSNMCERQKRDAWEAGYDQGGKGNKKGRHNQWSESRKYDKTDHDRDDKDKDRDGSGWGNSGWGSSGGSWTQAWTAWLSTTGAWAMNTDNGKTNIVIVEITDYSWILPVSIVIGATFLIVLIWIALTFDIQITPKSQRAKAKVKDEDEEEIIQIIKDRRKAVYGMKESPAKWTQMAEKNIAKHNCTFPHIATERSLLGSSVKISKGEEVAAASTGKVPEQEYLSVMTIYHVNHLTPLEILIDDGTVQDNLAKIHYSNEHCQVLKRLEQEEMAGKRELHWHDIPRFQSNGKDRVILIPWCRACYPNPPIKSSDSNFDNRVKLPKTMIAGQGRWI
jgi:hypothetical protein